MPGKFCISLTVAKDDPDRATVAFVVANAAVASSSPIYLLSYQVAMYAHQSFRRTE